MWAGLVAGEDGPVTIPPMSSVIVYTAMYPSGASDYGAYQLNVRTESLQ
jgi:hypothetical protein